MGPRRLLRAMAFACAALPFASRPLADWSAALPEGASAIHDVLVWLDTALAGWGLTAPFDAIHAAVRWLVAQPL